MDISKTSVLFLGSSYLVPRTELATYGFSVESKLYNDAYRAFRVRRSSDNAELDIGFVGDVIDMFTLLTFCTDTDGFITILYGQLYTLVITSAFVITTAALQPQIVNAGAIVTSKTGLPVIRFDTVDDYFNTTMPISTNYRLVSGSWFDSQEYVGTTQPSGSTRFPFGSTTLGMTGSTWFYFPESEDASHAKEYLKTRYMSDETETDIVRFGFTTAGAKTLSLTAGAGHGITFEDKSGSMNDSYSRTVDAFDWLVMRATDPTKITAIDWNTKTLHGQLYSDGFARLINMTYFSCRTNQLTGSIPSLTANTLLTIFSCRENQLTGSIPDLTTNTALTQFYCNSNQLTGSIPSLTTNTALTTFNCNGNQLTGSIPSLTTNTALTQFYCYSNQFTGSIPSLTANIELTDFRCNSNQLTGSIPSLTANIELTVFYCHTNQLTGYDGGAFPATLGTFEAQNNLLTESDVNAILAGLVAGGRNSGTRSCKLAGTGNAAPTGQGLIDLETARTTLGWTVEVNS